MNSSDQEKQDQGTNAGMEDNNAMTIEFLRARLLSERSVSKSARQRANELEKRVAELEEQLRIVSVQRMKAEKATADVLAILESNGLSDVSDMYDSLSDQETPREAKVGNEFSKEAKNSVNTKMSEDESEELSVSDLDLSPASARSLSWKGRKDSPCPIEKNRDPSLRRRSSFPSTYSSPKPCKGKSCRQIRHKQSRSVVEEAKGNPTKVDTSEIEHTTMENFPNGSNVGPDMSGAVENEKEETSLQGCLEHEQNLSTDCDYDANGGETDVEKALEHRAQLIGQYEEMERAQREWEEKFRENNSSTPV
uniref:Uncharacterized protein n=1 Tax=Rhizophora mucronata TaxID=61149 RepID=A0A2P2L2C3_RHIMU